MKDQLFIYAAQVVKIANPLPQATADQNKIKIALSIVFSIIGAIAVLVITISGFRYVLSHGDPSQIAQSKKSIIYALVGVVVSIMGITIVNLVIKNVG